MLYVLTIDTPFHAARYTLEPGQLLWDPKGWAGDNPPYHESIPVPEDLDLPDTLTIFSAAEAFGMGVFHPRLVLSSGDVTEADDEDENPGKKFDFNGADSDEEDPGEESEEESGGESGDQKEFNFSAAPGEEDTTVAQPPKTRARRSREK